MKLHGAVTMNGRRYNAGAEVKWYAIYPFFLFHMGMFGLSGFFMAYAGQGVPLFFMYLHGGIAILVYTIFYLTIFGFDEVKWMFINAGLGVLGIYAQVDWLLSLFGRRIADYPLSRHVTPFLYYTLYTFLLRHALLDLFGARDDDGKKQKVETSYIIGSVALSALFRLLERK